MVKESLDVFPIKDFIRPEDLFCNSIYLLFSEDRAKEEERARQIKEAFRSANLNPLQLVVKEKAIILVCDCYAEISRYDHLQYGHEFEFYRLLAPAKCEVLAGEVPSKIGGRRSYIHSYVFKE